MNYNYLQDSNFLKAIDTQHYKKYYNKINVLDKYDRVIAELDCLIKDGGSITINGNSAVRRQCSLTAIIPENEEVKIKEIYNLFEPNKQVEILTGIKNNLKQSFPQWKDLDIIWFPMGRFILTTPSFKNSSGGIEISLQKTDKMALMNGECGGVFPADVELSTKDDYVTSEGQIKYQSAIPIPIKQMVMEMVNHWGGEQIPKILVDIPEQVKSVKQLSALTAKSKFLSLKSINNIFEQEKSLYIGEIVSTKPGSDTIYFETSQDIGFMYEDFTYPEENGLVAAKGSTVASVLENVKNKLGNYEFFYDKFGNFIFQEIKNYLNTSQSMDILDALSGINNSYTLDRYKNKSIYSFDDSNLISSYSNNPQYNLIKNDFVIWGKKKNNVVIRYHLVLDENPIKEEMIVSNMSFLEMPFIDENSKSITITLVRVLEKSNENGILGVYYYDSSDNLYAWDGFKYVLLKDYLDLTDMSDFVLHKNVPPFKIPKEDWRTQLFMQGVIAEAVGDATNYYFAELKNEWPKIIDVKKIFDGYKDLNDIIVKDKTEINYFLDILETSDKISKYNITNIGRRTEVFHNDNINCIFENDIPEYAYIITDVEKAAGETALIEKIKNNYKDEVEMIWNQGYTPVFLYYDDRKCMSMGGKLNSAYEAAKNLLYQFTGYNEKISLSVLPIYYLEPNTRISVTDLKSNIQGDYIIDSINIPLNGNGMMSLTCSRALDKL